MVAGALFFQTFDVGRERVRGLYDLLDFNVWNTKQVFVFGLKFIRQKFKQLIDGVVFDRHVGAADPLIKIFHGRR